MVVETERGAPATVSVSIHGIMSIYIIVGIDLEMPYWCIGLVGLDLGRDVDFSLVGGSSSRRKLFWWYPCLWNALDAWLWILRLLYAWKRQQVALFLYWWHLSSSTLVGAKHSVFLFSFSHVPEIHVQQRHKWQDIELEGSAMNKYWSNGGGTAFFMRINGYNVFVHFD